MFSSRLGFFNPIIEVTGGTKTTDGAYTIRTFTSNGNLVIKGGQLNFEYLLVGAGGNGASNSPNAGGGGAGGEVLTGNISKGPGTYGVTIGLNASGNGATIFDSLDAVKGGDGSGTTGGDLLTFTGGTGSGSLAGGGGAGSNGNGGNGSLSPGLEYTGGSGGAAISSSISGTNHTYGRGGGGGGRDFPGSSDGTGGAGASNTTNAGTPATNRGGGGGGGYSSRAPTNGADGVFIIRYLTSGTS